MSTDNKKDDFVIESGYEELDPNSPVIGYEKRGRCTKCWGQLRGRKDGKGKYNYIGCQSCNVLLKGDEAYHEWLLMIEESEDNLEKSCRHTVAEYRKGAKFVLKILPHMKRDRFYFDRRVSAKLKGPRKRRKLTRHTISKGSAGYFFLQACAIMAGIESHPEVDSVIPYTEYVNNRLNIVAFESTNDEPSLHFTVKSNSDPRWLSRCLMRNMGTVITLGMNSAFACELALKALLITRKDEAETTHNLINLFQNLPEDCKSRMKVDFNEIEDVVFQGRNLFGDWRYLLNEESEESMLALANFERANLLAKAARVLIDEGIIAGLNYEIDVNHEFEIDFRNPDILQVQNLRLNVSANEAPINWQNFQDRNEEHC